VIAEAGGILFQSAISARDGGFPAVVSGPGACQILDDTPVTEDGDRSLFVVHERIGGSPVYLHRPGTDG
jgi:hypothetical protein